MSSYLLWILSGILLAIGAFGQVRLQGWVEEWDQRKHKED